MDEQKEYLLQAATGMVISIFIVLVMAMLVVYLLPGPTSSERLPRSEDEVGAPVARSSHGRHEGEEEKNGSAQRYPRTP